MSIGRRTSSWLIVGLGCLAAACGERPPTGAGAALPARIVSLAPSLTETLLALELEDRVVGVTRFCPEVAGAVEVGGYVDPNIEGIVDLDPDLVLLMQSHDVLERRLSELGLVTFRVDQHDIAGVLDSVEAIAARCGVPDRGRRLAADLWDDLDGVAAAVADRERPRTLVVVGREIGGGIGALWAAAPDTFFDDVVRLAGGDNVITGSTIRYPELSREGLFVLDPDVILDVVADGGVRGIAPADAAADWLELDELAAVRGGRVIVLDEDYVAIPGPRIVDTVRTVARALHPAVELP
ncbi:MAG TPA: helical backbone metal receptor [Methylomirabilota bacterium]|nr:helical backbone metal receptor [Methylomirabilota bacterium]